MLGDAILVLLDEVDAFLLPTGFGVRFPLLRRGATELEQQQRREHDQRQNGRESAGTPIYHHGCVLHRHRQIVVTATPGCKCTG